MTFPRQLSASADRPLARSFFDRGLVPGWGNRGSLIISLDRIGANGLRRSLTLEGVDRRAVPARVTLQGHSLRKPAQSIGEACINHGGNQVLCKGRTDNGRRALCPPIRLASQGA